MHWAALYGARIVIDSTLTPIKRRSRREVKQGLRERGYTQADVARLGRVSPSMVSHWLRRETKSSKLDRLVERLLNGGAS